MAFWTELKKSDFEPKQNFKWRVLLNANEDSLFYAVSVTKPNFQVQTKKFKLVNVEENHPANVVWSPVQITFIDSTDNALLNQIKSSFFSHDLDLQKGNLNYYGYARKNKFGSVTIETLNNEGNKVEVWTLENPIPTQLEMAELNYRNDDLSTYKLTLQYDWATVNTVNDLEAKEKKEDGKTRNKADEKAIYTPEISSYNLPELEISKGNAQMPTSYNNNLPPKPDNSNLVNGVSRGARKAREERKQGSSSGYRLVPGGGRTNSIGGIVNIPSSD